MAAAERQLREDEQRPGESNMDFWRRQPAEYWRARGIWDHEALLRIRDEEWRELLNDPIDDAEEDG